MTNTSANSTLKGAISEIVGRQLSSVTFVQDYVQLAFDGSGLNAYTHPTVSLGDHRLKWGEVGYRDALCHEIAHLVQQVEVDEQHVALSFDNGAVISISCLDKDYLGPEALMFSSDRDGRRFVV